ncbi:MAG: epimerase [Leptospiraceae bacterium]|nr:MAG: epimerase [Leptospiraceae bacterium]
MDTIVITGGSGFLGRKLTDYLSKNYKIIHISRSGKSYKNIPCYKWDPDNKNISEEGKKAIQNADAIIHLAGANIAEKKWDENYKNIIIQSRVNSTTFLCEILNHNNLDKRPEVAILASAIGYYGDRKDEILTETSPPGKGFLAETGIQWEQASINLHPEIRKVQIRIGFVLDKEEGGFPKMIMPIKFFLGAIPGSGKQYVSWIHIEDLLRIFEYFIVNQTANGIYNGTAPNPVTLEELMKKSAHYLQRPLLLPNIPDFVIQLLMGEMSELILSSTRVIPDRLNKEGFEFRYKTIDYALKNLLTT